MTRPGVNWGAVSRACGYAVFFVIALIALMYARFPSAAVEAALRRAADGMSAEAEVSGAALSFPPGLAIEKIILPGGGAGEVVLGSVALTPLYAPIMKGGLGAHMTAKILGGDVWMDARTPGDGRDEISIAFGASGIDPGLLGAWDDFPWGRFGGRIEGSGEAVIAGGDILKSSGRLAAALRDGKIRITEALFPGMGEIRLDSGEALILYDSGRLTVERGRIEGPGIFADISGDVIFAQNPRYSRLNLKARIRLEGELKERLGPFLSFFPEEAGQTVIRLGGTIASPSAR